MFVGAFTSLLVILTVAMLVWGDWVLFSVTYNVLRRPASQRD
jgi:hypothetical protein